MGICIFCGQKAGFLKKKHKECELYYCAGKHNIVESVSAAITQTSDFDNLDNEIKIIAATNHIMAIDMTGLYIKGFDNAVDSFLDDGVLSLEEENKIEKFRTHYDFDQDILDKNGSLQKMVKASILREILEGKIPAYPLENEDNLPFMLQKGEIVIWIFHNVDYYEQRTRTEFQGRSQGISIKIAKGLYYRTGAFKGHPVMIEEMKYLDKGLVALTNEHIYFASPMKSFKVPYDKIVTVNPYEDGVGIQKDGANAKPQVFKGLDGWFIYNLISNLNKL